MRIAVLTFDAFNEIDSFVVANLLNRVAAPGWSARLAGPTARVVSGRGVAVEMQEPLEFAAEADAVVIGSGMRTGAVIADPAMLARIRLDPRRQLVASQCSGAMILARLGLLGDAPACTDLMTAPELGAMGVMVLDRAFHARGNVATAGGCLAAQYIAAWLIARVLGTAEAARVIGYVAPVGEKDEYAARALAAVTPFLGEDRAARAVA
ncbi:MAG: DJ-1/PfpI family protein [Alphaproteobacteria bacterium]